MHRKAQQKRPEKAITTMFVILLLVLSTAMTTSCESEQQKKENEKEKVRKEMMSQLVGKYESEGGNAWITLNEDGTILAVAIESKHPEHGMWNKDNNYEGTYELTPDLSYIEATYYIDDGMKESHMSYKIQHTQAGEIYLYGFRYGTYFYKIHEDS